MKKQRLQLSLIDTFNCIGGECPSSCCKTRWRIDIDEDTFNKWLSIKDTQIKERLLKTIIKDEERGDHFFHKNPDTSCVNLRKDGYCWIHAELGEEYLSRTCRTYPRLHRDDSFYESYSLRMSCPEVVNQLYELSKAKKNVTKKSAAKSNLFIPGINGIDPFIISTLDKFVNDVMGKEKYYPNVKLFLIAKTLAEISIYSENGSLTPELLKKLCSQVNSNLYDINQQIKNKKIASDPVLDGRFWKFVFKLILNAEKLLESDSESEELLSQLLRDDDSNEYFIMLADKVARYKEDMAAKTDDSFKNFMNNYIKTKFINNEFPWFPFKNNFIATFLFCLYPYALIQLLVIIKSQNNILLKEDLVSIVYKVEQKLDHNNKLYQLLVDNPKFLNISHYLSCLRLL